MSDLATVQVFRFDPSVDKEPRYQIFEGVKYENRSVLEVINLIYEERDQTLAFREGCGNGTCTGCAIMLNRIPVLACQAPAEREMVIEPHPKFEIIKDLAVDFNKVK